jgi:alkylation response protein AidB-like acyl-CoA dehydrogenase
MQVPERDGGAGVDDLRFNVAVAQEAMAAGAPALALTLAIHNDVCVPLLLAHGDDAAALATGELLGAFVGEEASLRSRAVGEGQELDGDASYVVAGFSAERLLVVAGEELFLVDGEAEGLERPRSAELVGLWALDLADLRFAGVAARRLGGPELVRDAEIARRLAVAACALAGARAALDWTLAYVADRRAFGQPIARFQNTRVVLADLAAAIDAGAALFDACLAERLERRLTAARAATVKLICSELHGRAVDCGVQLHGGYGYMLEYPIARAYADARLLRLYAGTSEALRETIADAIGV